MAAVWVRARAELRARWRAALGLAILVGIAGGAVIAAAAGARRTDSAHARFLEATNPFDVGVPEPFFEGLAKFDLDRVASLPQVIDSAPVQFFENAENVDLMVPPDGRAGRDISRFKVLEGRFPDPRRADEVLAPQPLARRLGLRVGGVVHLRFVLAERHEAKPVFDRGEDPQQGPGFADPMTFRVVGIGISHFDFPPHLTFQPSLLLTPAFYRQNAERFSHLGGVIVRLRHGARDVPAFERDLERLAGGDIFFTIKSADHNANVQRSIHLQAVALWLLAGLTAVASLLVFSQTLARQMLLESSDHPTLRSLGMTRGQLWLVAMVRSAAVAAVGAALAAAVAVALSPLTPIGLARLAEPAPGIAVDGAAVGLGVGAMVLLVLALSAVPAWRASGEAVSAAGVAEPAGTRPSRLAGALARAGFAPASVTGVRMALETGRGATAVPVRTTLAGVTLGVLALTTAFTFGASLTHLFRTPRLYGWTWHAQLFAQVPEDQAEKVLRGDPRIEAFSAGDSGLQVRVGTRTTGALSTDGSLVPPVVEGRPPRGPNVDREILLGTETLRDLDRKVGDSVRLRVQGAPGSGSDMRIVGRAVFPPLAETLGLGKGVFLTNAAADRLVGGFEADEGGATYMIRFRPGVDVEEAMADLRRAFGRPELQGRRAPTDLINFGRVDNLPVTLAGGVALIAAATLAHTLVTSIRRRRRDLAILVTLGFVRGQVRRAIAWQATTVVAIALLVGVPLGVAAGRWAWTLFADRLGIVPVPVVSLAATLLTIPAAILLANLIAALPACVAARLRPALVLRTE